MNKQVQLLHPDIRPKSNRELLARRYRLEMFVYQVNQNDSKRVNLYYLGANGPQGGVKNTIHTSQMEQIITSRIEADNHDQAYLRRTPSDKDLNQYLKLVEAMGSETPVMIISDTYRPNRPRLFSVRGAFYHNRWIASRVSPSGDNKKGRPALYQEFLDRFFPDIEQQDFFDYWCAQLVAYPDEPTVTVIVLRGENGTGKNFWFDHVMARLIGVSNYRSLALKQIKGEFTGHAKMSTLMFLDEGKDKSPATYDLLKRMSTETFTQVNEKYEKQWTLEPFYRIVHASNHEAPFLIDDGDRRFWVPDWQTFKLIRESKTSDLREAREEHRQFIVRFAKWLDEKGGLQELCDYYHSVPFDPDRLRADAPLTKDRSKLVRHNVEEERIALLKDYLKNHRDHRVSPTLLQGKKEFRHLTIAAIKDVLTKEGWFVAQRRGRYERDGKTSQTTFWNHPRHQHKEGHELAAIRKFPIAGFYIGNADPFYGSDDEDDE